MTKIPEKKKGGDIQGDFPLQQTTRQGGPLLVMSMSVRGGGGGGGGVNGSGNQACAACKYQRRKCTPDCLLAPYFPPDQQRQFLNAHKLFGVSYIGKIIKNLDPIQRAEAMRSIVFQSDARARDPVGGCHRIILELQRQIDRDSIELDLVLRQLAIFREYHHHQQHHLAAAAGAADELLVGLDINKECKAITRFCATRWHRRRANLMRNYFYSPWAILSLVAALLLLLLTITQTVFSVYPNV